MQTFLPYADFSKSANVLDYRRLGKQRVETLQILRVLSVNTQSLIGQSTAWSNHPAVKMWRGFEAALQSYGIVICKEWISRGYKDTCLDKIASIVINTTINVPSWLGNKQFHLAHQSNLLRKDYAYYSKYFNVPSNLPYYWPV